jgi:hypothetical protein
MTFRENRYLSFEKKAKDGFLISKYQAMGLVERR